MKKLISILTFIFMLPLHLASAAESPKVVVSIKPIHSLVSAIMEGVGTPQLIVKSGSPHGYTLRPSEASSLARADLIVWVGHELESFLDKPLKVLSKGSIKLELAEQLESSLLTKRDTENWEHSNHDHDRHQALEGSESHETHEAHEKHEAHESHEALEKHEGSMDLHIWLSP
jgi:zinc transport system substrate-binding protein